MAGLTLIFAFFAVALSVFAPSVGWAQIKAGQAWNLSVPIASDAISVSCSKFELPFFLGRKLAEPNTIGTDTGEMSQSFRSTFPIKITLLPQSGTSDTLATINGCSIDGSNLYLSTQTVGHIITLTSTGNMDLDGGTVTLSAPNQIVQLERRSGVYYLVGGSCVVAGGGGGSLSRVITDAFDVVSALSVGDGSAGIRIWAENNTGHIQCFSSGNNPCAEMDIVTGAGQVLRFLDGGSPYLIVDPDNGVTNNRYQFQGEYYIRLSQEVALYPSGNCTVAEESIVTGDPIDNWITCADTVGDAVSFNFKATARLVTGDVFTIRLHAVNTNVSASGTYSLQCAASSIEPGVDDYVTHNTTGQGTVSFTFANEDRAEMASANFTVNGAISTGSHIKGQCNVSAVPAQIADVRLSHTAIIEVSGNSLSD